MSDRSAEIVSHCASKLNRAANKDKCRKRVSIRGSFFFRTKYEREHGFTFTNVIRHVRYARDYRNGLFSTARIAGCNILISAHAPSFIEIVIPQFLSRSTIIS